MARKGKKGDAGEEVARGILALLEKEPFYAHVLGGVVRELGEATPTAAVGVRRGRVALMVNPGFFLGLAGPERVGVLKHEVLHLVLRHLLRFDRDRHDPARWNVAADLVVNQLVGKPWKLPEGAITLATFPQLEPDQTLEWYYQRLGGELPAPSHSDHGHWGASGGEDEPLPWDAARAAADTAIDRLIAGAADRVGPRMWGALPARVQDEIRLVFARRKPQLDWRRVVRLFAASSRRTRIQPTLRQPSVRYGTLPGIRVRRLSRLCVAIDVSGSIDDQTLELFFAEVHGLWRAGADVTVVECDAAVQRVWAYRGKPPASRPGRGGTAFDPVFAHLRETGRWDGCLYLTDGHGPEPRVKAPCPLLWVVTPDGGTDTLTGLGRVVRLPGS